MQPGRPCRVCRSRILRRPVCRVAVDLPRPSSEPSLVSLCDRAALCVRLFAFVIDGALASPDVGA
eukprot:6771078-Prymnesium_polylepis.1